MGIINMTPDSFSDGGAYKSVDDALEHVKEMLADGASIIDVGGESTRPGATFVDAKEELKRIIPLIKSIRKNLSNALVSVDTYKDEVAEKAVEAGAHIINDVWGMSHKNYDMLGVVSERQVPVVVTHNQENVDHKTDVVYQILSFFDSIKNASIKKGISEGNLIFDPGIGLGKTWKQNIEILRRIKEIRDKIDSPLLLGVSKKGFLGRISNNLNPKERVIESIAAHLYLVEKGVDVLRVHDVKENMRALKVFQELKSSLTEN